MIFTMDGFDAYKKYLAIKSHFTTKSYDYFKYNGAVRVTRESFEKRSDKYFFQKLAKHDDLVNFIVSFFVYNDKQHWVGDMINDQSKTYEQMKKIHQSLMYVFKQDINNLSNDIGDLTAVIDGENPKLLTALLHKQISIETFIILNDVYGFSKKWNSQITEKYVWPKVKEKCKKYQPFLKYDKQKYHDVCVDYFGILK